MTDLKKSQDRNRNWFVWREEGCKVAVSGPGHMKAWSRETCEKLHFVVEALRVAMLSLSDQETTDTVSFQGYYYLGGKSHCRFMWKMVVSGFKTFIWRNKSLLQGSQSWETEKSVDVLFGMDVL